jgi:anti-sigma B factor antagonist
MADIHHPGENRLPPGVTGRLRGCGCRCRLAAWRREGAGRALSSRSVEPSELSIVVEECDESVVFTVAGEIDLVTSTRLKRALDDVLQGSPPPARVTADLAGVGFMDTSGVAVLLAARRRAHELGSRLVVTSTSPFLARLFEMTGIGRVLLDEPR